MRMHACMMMVGFVVDFARRDGQGQREMVEITGQQFEGGNMRNFDYVKSRELLAAHTSDRIVSARSHCNLTIYDSCTSVLHGKRGQRSAYSTLERVNSRSKRAKGVRSRSRDGFPPLKRVALCFFSRFARLWRTRSSVGKVDSRGRQSSKVVVHHSDQSLATCHRLHLLQSAHTLIHLGRSFTMDIDLPSNTFPSASSTEPMFTPGGKRKRGFEQDVMQEHVPGQTLDEGSAAKVSGFKSRLGTMQTRG